MLGLVLLLLAHIVYTFVFSQLGGPSRWDWLSAILLLAAGALVHRLLLPNLGSMKIPVLVHILVLSLMVHQALKALSSPNFSACQSWMVVVGAILFNFFDLIPALNHF